MIESLARCVKWDANGGKSGSAFLKTRGMFASRRRYMNAQRDADDRFIAKELSKAELQSLATFAPAYFEYMSSTVTAQVSRAITPTPTKPDLRRQATYAARQDLRVLQDYLQEDPGSRY